MSEFDETTERVYLRTEARSAENTSGRVSSPARSSRDPSPHHQESITPDQRKQGAEIKAEHAITDERPGTSAFDEIVHDGDSDGGGRGGGERSPAPPRRGRSPPSGDRSAHQPSNAIREPPPTLARAAGHAPRTDGPASKPRYGRSRAPRRRRARTTRAPSRQRWSARVDRVVGVLGLDPLTDRTPAHLPQAGARGCRMTHTHARARTPSIAVFWPSPRARGASTSAAESLAKRTRRRRAERMRRAAPRR